MKRILIVCMLGLTLLFLFSFGVSEKALNKMEQDYVDNLNGKPLEWYKQEYFIVLKKTSEKITLKNQQTNNVLELKKSFIKEDYSFIKVGDEVVIFRNPNTNQFIKLATIFP